jgi:hypothetical protein
MDETTIQHGIVRIQELAAYVIEEFGPISDIDFGFNRESLAWIEGLVERERNRRDLREGLPEGLINTLGSFFGECIVVATDGVWCWHEGQQDWGVHFKSGVYAFPFAKLSKQFKNGLEGGDSILGFYDLSVKHISREGMP